MQPAAIDATNALLTTASKLHDATAGGAYEPSIVSTDSSGASSPTASSRQTLHPLRGMNALNLAAANIVTDFRQKSSQKRTRTNQEESDGASSPDHADDAEEQAHKVPRANVAHTTASGASDVQSAEEDEEHHDDDEEGEDDEGTTIDDTSSHAARGLTGSNVVAPRERRLKSLSQLVILKNFYAQHPRVNKEQVRKLIQQTGLTHREVTRWFRNERHKEKKQKAQAELLGGLAAASHLPIANPHPLVSISVAQQQMLIENEKKRNQALMRPTASIDAQHPPNGTSMKVKRTPSSTSSSSSTTGQMQPSFAPVPFNFQPQPQPPMMQPTMMQAPFFHPAAMPMMPMAMPTQMMPPTQMQQQAQTNFFAPNVMMMLPPPNPNGTITLTQQQLQQLLLQQQVMFQQQQQHQQPQQLAMPINSFIPMQTMMQAQAQQNQQSLTPASPSNQTSSTSMSRPQQSQAPQFQTLPNGMVLQQPPTAYFTMSNGAAPFGLMSSPTNLQPMAVPTLPPMQLTTLTTTPSPVATPTSAAAASPQQP